MKKRDEHKQTKIQDAVAQIILTEGPAGVSTTKVARLVGIAQSNVYLYFKNKAELINSVYAREVARIMATTDLASLTDQTQTLAQRLKQYIQQIYMYSLAHPTSLTLIQQIKSLRGQGMELTIGAADPNNVVVELLNEAIHAGVIKDLPISLHMSLVFSIVHTHTTNLAAQQYPQSRYSFDTIYHFIWDAMRRFPA